MDIKKIPIIGDIDFSDPDKRKSSIRICAAGAMVVIVLIAMVVRKSMDAKAAEQAAAAESQYESLSIPMGNSKEDIGGKTMTDISKRRGTPGGHAKDIFPEDLAQEDPLAALSGETKTDPNDDPLKDTEGDNLPGFMKMHRDMNKHTDVYPESESKQKEERTAMKAGEAASRAINGVSETKPVGKKDLENMTYEERRRYLYLQNGLDPDTGEPLAGGPLDPSAQRNAGQGPAKAAGGQRGSSSQKPSASSSKNASGVDATDKQEEKTHEPAVEPAKVQVRRSGAVSAFGMTGSSAGTSISTLGDASEYVPDDPTHLFKVKFAYDEKVSSGQRVTIRLCEDMVVDGILIPENTHLFATCSVGERLELKVSSINVNGKIYTIDYVAYDNDGEQGLYCPQSEASKAIQKAGEAAEQIGQQAISSAITGYPGRIINAGTQIINSKKGKTTVSVTAGYSFYLMQK